MLINGISLDLYCTLLQHAVSFYVHVSLASSFLSEKSSVMFVFSESIFSGFGFKILMAEDNAPDKQTK